MHICFKFFKYLFLGVYIQFEEICSGKDKLINSKKIGFTGVGKHRYSQINYLFKNTNMPIYDVTIRDFSFKRNNKNIFISINRNVLLKSFLFV